MLILPNILTAVEQLWANKMRSVLTVLGIVIAVASTITVVSVVRGFTGYVSDFLQGLGTNAMWVWPYRPPGEAGETLGRVGITTDGVAAGGFRGARRATIDAFRDALTERGVIATVRLTRGRDIDAACGQLAAKAAA